jgi:hypothetical protein
MGSNSSLSALKEVLNTLYDMGFVGISAVILAAASRPGRRHYLPFVVPAAVAMALTAVYRCFLEYAYVFTQGRFTHPYWTVTALYASDAVAFYSCFMLLRVLRDSPSSFIRPHRRHGRPALARKRRLRGRHPARLERS